MNISIRNKYETLEEYELTAANLCTAVNDVSYLTEVAADADFHVYAVHVFIGEFLIDTTRLLESLSESQAQNIIDRSQEVVIAIDAFDSSNKQIIEIKEVMERWIISNEISRNEKTKAINFMYERANLLCGMLLSK